MENSRKCLYLDMQESALHGDAVFKWTWSFSGKKSAGMGCFPHYFPHKEPPEPIALFPMVRACTLFRWVLAYVMEVRRGLNKGRIKAHCSSNNRKDKTTRNFNLSKSVVQLIPGDMCWMKVNPFQGERKMDSRWDEEDYEITCQVANGLSSHETEGSSGRVKAPHQNRFFQVATLWGVSMALCHNEYANVDLTTRSALTESTPLECDIDLPRNNMEEQLSQCSTSLSLRGQVDGIQRSLYEVVPSTAMKDNRDGRRDKCACDDEPHWLPPVYFLACHLNPNFHFELKHKKGRGKGCNRSIDTRTGFGVIA